MGFKDFILVLGIVISCANAQTFRACVVDDSIRCQNLDKDGSLVSCLSVPTRVECAVQMNRGNAFGVFTEEELLLLAQRNPNDHRVIATVRDVNRITNPFAFEAVALVPNNHTNGFEGLRGGRYCHPGLGATSMRWSPRVLRALETLSARTDQCPSETRGRTTEELEVEILSNFFSEACRPGPWSANPTHDADLKRRFPNLCAMCSASGVCEGYNNPMAINIAGVSNRDTHIQAIDCLVNNGTVAFVAWSHVVDYFRNARPDLIGNYSVLCEDGTTNPLTMSLDLGGNLIVETSPCSLVRQPWRTIVANTATAEGLLSSLQNWWPSGLNPGGNTWQANLYSALAGVNTGVVFESTLLSPLNYTRAIRPIPEIDATSSCVPARRWCTVSAAEQDKCTWLRAAAHSLGVRPAVACQQRAAVFECLRDIRDDRADFFSVDTHFGYLARAHFRLTPVKLVQNPSASSSRVAVLVKESATNEISRFENLRDKVACFPEFGGLAYVAFVRAAHERGVISSQQCDYARAVGEFFNSSCAPGALDASHIIYNTSTFDATTLCTACRQSTPVAANASDFTCAWDYTNMFYGNNGSLMCLNDPNTHVAFVEMQDIRAQIRALGLQESSFRALCSNNSLAWSAGVVVPDDCLIAHVVDAEILTRRNDPHFNSLGSLLDSIEELFGYNVMTAEQLINFRVYSPFDGVSDLLFKDTTNGLTAPTLETGHQPARNYIEMFRHLDACTSSAPTTPAPGSAKRIYISFFTLAMMALTARMMAD